MDNFGFETQGLNYNQFRPKYPRCLYEYTINKINSRSMYLDVAMGTGQLLFHIAPYFSYNKGIDISDKMLETANNIFFTQYKHLKDKVSIQKCDVMHLPTEQKYDLITIGQALHWFPIQQSLIKLKNLLEPGGKLLVLSYIMKGLEDPKQNEMYQRFYDKVKSYFDFDRNELQNHYSDKLKYPFDEIFSEVVRFSQQVHVPLTRDAYIKYLKTYSGYNRYLAKNGNEQNPLRQIQVGNNEKVTVILQFFKIQCGV